MIIFTKNARIGTDAKLAELLGELNGRIRMGCDFVLGEPSERTG